MRKPRPMPSSMNTIDRLLIVGFQKHDRREFRFDPRVPVLAGPTEIGKSSIVRMLRLILLNVTPKGDYVSWGFDRNHAFGLLTFSDGRRIVRRKGPTVNSYRVDGKEVLGAVGKAVPRAVADLGACGPVNFAGQHDAAFWFCLSPGEVARELDAIVDLAVIDRSMAFNAKRLREAEAAEKLTVERVEVARGRRRELKWVVAADRDLREIEAKLDQLDQLDRVCEGLAVMIEEGERAGERLRHARKALHAAGKAVSAVDPAVARKVEDLETLIGRGEEAAEALAAAGKRLARAEAAIAAVADCPLCGRPRT